MAPNSESLTLISFQMGFPFSYYNTLSITPSKALNTVGDTFMYSLYNTFNKIDADI